MGFGFAQVALVALYPWTSVLRSYGCINNLSGGRRDFILTYLTVLYFLTCTVCRAIGIIKPRAFHPIERLATIWMVPCSRTDSTDWEGPKPYSVVCSEHFHEESFVGRKQNARFSQPVWLPLSTYVKNQSLSTVYIDDFVCWVINALGPLSTLLCQ